MTQCPNCGGYKVSDTPVTWRVSRKTGERVEIRPLWPPIIWAVAVLATVPLSFNVSRYLKDPHEWLIGSSLALEGIYLVVLATIVIWELRRWVRFADTKKVQAYQYACTLCGHRWSWKVSDPRPPVGPPAHPELQALGEARLQQEAAEMERRRKAAAENALWRRQRGEI